MPDDNSGLIPVQDALFNATTARGFEVGQEVFGRFKLVKVLGRGGMGIVWLAHDKQLEQDVAIKVLPDLVMHDREAVSDMKRETKRSLQLNHHNIVRIYDFNQDDKGAGISMEYVDGETLSAAKAERPHGCFDTADIKAWIEQICDALAYAHHVAKIVHRDLKPANIMLTKSGTIKVTDFGIARSISDSISRVSMRHATSGTMVYMSPQQSSGARSSPSDDVYALGATIYDLLTGKPPFYSGNIQHQLESITPPSMTERRAELEHTGAPIPAHWEKAVAACLAKEISRRPASIRELAGMLQLGNATSLVAPTETSKSATVEKSSVLLPVVEPAPAPPPPPKKPFRLPVPNWPRGTWIGIAVGVGIVVLTTALGISIPIIIGKGSITVNTSPPGAQVSLGAQSSPSPATFSQIWSGDKVVSVSLDGYNPVQLPVKVVKNKVADLGLVTLIRSTGEVTVRTIPTAATCSFMLIESPVAGEADPKKSLAGGRTPYKSPLLPTGKFNVLITANDFPDHTQTIELKPADKLSVVTDLVKENSLHLLGPDALAAVSLDQPVPDNLAKDPATRSSLIAYFQSTEHGYMQAREYKLAEAQLQHLTKDLGVDIASPEKQLESSQSGWIKTEKESFEDLVEDGRFYSAAALLNDEDARSLTPATATLRDELTKARAAHDQKIDKTLSDIAALQTAGKSDDAYQLAVAQAAHAGEDARLTQELASLELAMPSTFERVSTRFKSMDDLLSFDPDLGQQAEFMRLHGIFSKNLDRHHDYQSRIATLESTVDGYDSRIADVRAEIRHNQAKANGYHALTALGFLGGIAGAAANSAPGAVAGFGTAALSANSGNQRDADVRSLQGEVGSLESERQPSEDQLDALKKEYADFCKTLIGEVQ